VAAMVRKPGICIALTMLVSAPAFSQASEERCIIDRSRPGKGHAVHWSMIVQKNGAPCEISLEFRGGPATSIMIHEQPKNGILSIEAPAIRYTPNANFTGNDIFEVQWFGMDWGPYQGNPNRRTRIQVIVYEKRQ
jgi:hypothetical protein